MVFLLEKELKQNKIFIVEQMDELSIFAGRGLGPTRKPECYICIKTITNNTSLYKLSAKR